jgi:aldose 1-epimerase
MKKNFSITVILLTIFAFPPFAQTPLTGTSKVTRRVFGETADGVAIDLYNLTNAKGMEASIMTRGGILVSLLAPDRNGKLADVVLGYDDFAAYEAGSTFFGALIGRYGNRIGGARFTLNGVEYQLTNTLHGGKQGFDKRVWRATEVSDPEGPSLELTYISKDGEEGFPGTLSAKVVYTLTSQNELKIDYTATTDKDTVVNLTNHSYFNLAGAGEGDVLRHQVTINADRFTAVDSGLIPTGELRSVKGTPFDFTKPVAIGTHIDQDDEQLKFGRGYDHNWVLNERRGSLSKAAEVYEPSSGRVMEVWTTEPGLQFYTGNSLGAIRGKGGNVYGRRGAFCMETQHFPDSPNKPDFPTTLLKPGSIYHTTTIYRFSAR